MNATVTPCTPPGFCVTTASTVAVPVPAARVVGVTVTPTSAWNVTSAVAVATGLRVATVAVIVARPGVAAVTVTEQYPVPSVTQDAAEKATGMLEVNATVTPCEPAALVTTASIVAVPVPAVTVAGVIVMRTPWNVTSAAPVATGFASATVPVIVARPGVARLTVTVQWPVASVAHDGAEKVTAVLDVNATVAPWTPTVFCVTNASTVAVAAPAASVGGVIVTATVAGVAGTYATKNVTSAAPVATGTASATVAVIVARPGVARLTVTVQWPVASVAQDGAEKSTGMLEVNATVAPSAPTAFCVTNASIVAVPVPATTVAGVIVTATVAAVPATYGLKWLSSALIVWVAVSTVDGSATAPPAGSRK